MPNKRIDQLPTSGNQIQGGDKLPIFSDNRTERITINELSSYIGTNTSDTYVNSGVYSAGTITFTNNSGGTFNVTGFTETIDTNTFITGGIYTLETLTLNNNSGGTVSITGITNVYPTEVVNAVTGQTVDWALSDNHEYTISGNTTFSFANDSDGKNISMAVIQDGTGGHTVTWPAGVKWGAGGTEPTMTSTSGSTDVYTLIKINGTVYGSYIQDFQ